MTDWAFAEDQPLAEPLEAEVIELEPVRAGAGSGFGRLQKALARQNVTEVLSEAKLTEIGADVVDDWNRDKNANSDWRERAEKALDVAAQEKPEAEKDYPFIGASDVQYPLLTIASNAFGARAYPAIVKGDEAIQVKTFGRDSKGAKKARAERVKDYLNWKLFYGVENWEQDTDVMLHRLPAVGQHFRKVWWDPIERKCCIESVSALRLTVPPDAPSLRLAPRITHDFDCYPYQIQRLMQAGHYRRVTLIPDGEDDQAARVLLEQHRMMDLDDDGLDEPYVVTVDASTSEVLRVDEAFSDDDIEMAEDGTILSIKRWMPFVDYSFIPDPKGRAYAIGFGHLLTPIMEVINTTINMQIDAGHAQVAGGGFIGAELRLQGAGQNGALYFQPGEYKTVTATGDDIRKAIYERTFPAPSPVLFQLLGMLMDAAKDIASVNEAITGDAARSAPVGTTLALIEQGQQVFNAIYKRIYRALREEFALFAECLRKYGDPEEYARFIDAEPTQMGHNGGPPMEAPEGMMPPQGPQMPMQGAPGLLPPTQPAPVDPVAAFEADFNAEDLDIRPISDPTAVTQQQRIARAQFILGLVPTGQINPQEATRRALEAAAVEDIDTLMQMPPQQPPPGAQETVAATLAKLMAEGRLADAKAMLTEAQAEKAKAEAQTIIPTAQVNGALTEAQALKARNDAFAAAAGILRPTFTGEPM